MLRQSILLAALLILSSTVAAQTYQWTELSFSQMPFAREDHAMAWDTARQNTVLFGGYNGAAMNDTWILGSAGWSQPNVTTSPPARWRHAMANDPVRGRVVVLGGWNTLDLTDVWEWD